VKTLRSLIPVALLALAVASPAGAADIQFFGTAKVKPTLYSNFDFDSSLNDAAALNEGGWASGEHVRSELRLGWKAAGDNWSVMMIVEADVINEKDTADRSFYGPATKNNWTNFGAEFGIERAEFSYTFDPMLKLSTGWNIRAMDIATGGMVFGDDHPFIELAGTVAPMVKYQLGYLQIQNRSTAPAPVVREPTLLNDWRAYYLKVPIDIAFEGAKLNLSPFVLKSDNESKYARVIYYGAEVTGQIAMVKPYLEVAFVTGDFDANRRGVGTPPVATDISSMAFFVGAELALHKAFNPYAAFRYTKGDDDATDSKAEGFVGVTDIGRFTPLLGMDGNILSEHLASGASPYNSPLYSFSPDRAVGGNVYGGIGNGSSGNNPGQQLIAVGAKGDLGDFVANLSYKAQVFLISYDKTGNLTNNQNPGQSVGKAVGTEVDVNLKYTFSKSFAIDLISSMILPGDGIKDQLTTTSSTTAQAHTLTLAWTY
jgi:hypothetical protein